MSRFSNGVGKIQYFPDVERLQMVLNQNKEIILNRSDMSKRELPSKYLAMSPAVGLCQQQLRFLAEDERTPCVTQGISARHCMRSAVNWPLLLPWYSSWCTLHSVLTWYSRTIVLLTVHSWRFSWARSLCLGPPASYSYLRSPLVPIKCDSLHLLSPCSLGQLALFVDPHHRIPLATGIETDKGKCSSISYKNLANAHYFFFIFFLLFLFLFFIPPRTSPFSLSTSKCSSTFLQQCLHI